MTDLNTKAVLTAIAGALLVISAENAIHPREVSAQIRPVDVVIFDIESGPLLRKAIDNHKRACRFVIGDDIKYVQEKSKLIVLDPDGKECNLDIVRQARLQP
jgi:hypothetical protein